MFKPRYDILALRDLFAVTHAGVAYLNHAGLSPLPTPVKEAMIQATNALAERGSLAYADLLDSITTQLAGAIGRLVNACPDEVAFVESTSMGINMIANSLPLRAGDHILLCDIEFPSNVYPWQNLARRGIKTRLVPSMQGGLTLEALDAARTPRSRVVAVSAVQFFSGRREDLAALGTYCAEHDLWLVVDAIQAAGVIPIDMRTMGIHAIAAGGQKALLGPPGQGFIAIREDLIDQMQPAFVGPLSVHGWEHWLSYDMTLRPGAERFFMGTSNIVGLAGLLAAINLVLDLGIEHIAAWVSHLSDIAIADLEQRGYQVITPHDPRHHAHIVTLAVPSSPEPLVAALQSQGVILRAHVDAEGNPHLRISSHAYNTEEDILRVGKILEGIEP